MSMGLGLGMGMGLDLGLDSEVDLGPYDSTTLGTPFQFHPATTPRQSLSMDDLLQPKSEPFSF